MPRKRNGPSPAIDSPERRRLPPLLRRAWYGLNQAFRRRIAHLALTPDQFTVLRTLIETESITQSKLTRLISSDPNTIAALVGRMTEAGWVERQTDPQDRRAKRLRLKPEGRDRYARARAIALELQAEVLGALSAVERESFLTQLDRIADACRAAAEQSG